MRAKDFTIKGWEKLIRKFWDKYFGEIDYFDPRCYNLTDIIEVSSDELEDMIDRHHIDFSDYDKIIV